MHIAERIGQLKVESAFDVLARARALESQGRNIIHLEIGEPDFPTPGHIVEAGKQALDEGWTHYGPTLGDPELRAEIGVYISRTRSIEADGRNVAITPGAKPILFFTALATLEAGDEALFPDPGFPIYESMIRFCGAAPVGYSPLPFDPDRTASLITPRTRLVILNSPHNPTGEVIPEASLRRFAELLTSHNLVVLSDEIYCRIFYSETAPFSIASVEGMQDRTIILDGFSKAYSMTGWRLGYGVMPERLTFAVSRLMVNSNSCTASFIQRAGLAALRGSDKEVLAMVSEFRRRRDAICAALNQAPGLCCRIPQGAFYAFPDVRSTGRSSGELASGLLDHAGVACLDGAGFGANGDGFLRFSYANSLEKITEAIHRIHSYLAK